MDKKCRTCSREDQFEGISVNAFSESHKEPIYLMLIYCTQLQYSTDDTLPQQICPECLALLDGAFTFWKQSRQTDANFRYGVLNRLVASSVQAVPSVPMEAAPAAESTPQKFWCCFRKCLKVTTSLDAMEEHAEQHHFAARLANEVQRVPDHGYVCSVCCAGFELLGSYEYHRMAQLGTRQKDYAGVSKKQQELMDDLGPAEATVVKDEELEEDEFRDESTSKPDMADETSTSSLLQFETVSVKDEPYFSAEDESLQQQDKPGSSRNQFTLKQCNTCQRTFNTAEEHKRHVAFCAKEKYTCANCGSAFSAKVNFEQHINYRACLTDPNQCKNCFATFPNTVALKLHRKVGCPALLNAESSGLKMTCNCDRCGKGFINKRLLRLHTIVDGCGVENRVVKPRKPLKSKFQCPHCFIPFTRVYNLKRHLQQHCVVLQKIQAEAEQVAAAMGQDTTGTVASTGVDTLN